MTKRTSSDIIGIFFSALLFKNINCILPSLRVQQLKFQSMQENSRHSEILA
jgi:hypothetical protein